MKKIISLILIIVSLCLILTSCGSKKDLIGTWAPKDFDLGEEYVLVFNEDGTGTYFGEVITYKVSGNKLSIWYEGTESFDTTFKISNGVLSFKDSLGDDVFWIKK